MMRHLVLAAVAACALTAGADTASHRREVRERIANLATRTAAIEAALKDEDPAVRRYAQFMKTVLKFRNSISDVEVLRDFPSLPVKTGLNVKIAPHDTLMLSVGEHEQPLPGTTCFQ